VRRPDLGVLGLRDFRLIFAGQTISSIGDMMFPVAVAAKVLESGGSAGDLGLVLAGRSLAMILFVLAGGIWADRLPRTFVMVGADAARLVAVLGLAIVPGDVDIWLLALLTFFVGGGEAFFRPAYGALLPSVVPEDRLGPANALTSVSLRSAMVIGPGIAGALLALPGGVRTAFVIDAFTFGVSMLTLLAVREPPMPVRTGPAEGALAEALAGVRAVRERPWIAAVLAMAAVQIMLAVAPEMVLLPTVAKERFGSTSAYGSIVAIGAVGGVVGALVSARWRPARRGLVAQLALLPWVLILVSLALP
jgi:MFS family permease